MPNEMQPDDDQNIKSVQPSLVDEELSEQELNDASGGAQPHMLPPGPCAPQHITQFVGDVNGKG